MLTIQEILRPRFRVAIKFPNSKYKVGDILVVCQNIHECESYKGQGIAILNEKKQFDEYPEIFKPLKWWEFRDASDMPEYIKVVAYGGGNYGKIFKAYDWKFLVFWTCNANNSSYAVDEIEPATEEDYNNSLIKP